MEENNLTLEEIVYINKTLKYSYKFRPKGNNADICRQVAAIIGTFPLEDRETYLKDLEPLFKRKKLSLRMELDTFLREVDELYNKVTKGQ
jgi:hypothetical protein